MGEGEGEGEGDREEGGGEYCWDEDSWEGSCVVVGGGYGRGVGGDLEIICGFVVGVVDEVDLLVVGE